MSDSSTSIRASSLLPPARARDAAGVIIHWIRARHCARRTRPSREAGLGTFGGVFTPSILTILGTILVITLSTSITFLTALSIATVATDRRVRIGGAYYL